MPTDLDRVVALLRHGHGDPLEVAEILNTDLATIRAVLEGSGSLPASGGGAAISGSMTVTHPTLLAVTTPAYSGATLVVADVQVQLQPGDQILVTLELNGAEANTTLDSSGGSNAAANAGLVVLDAKLVAIVPPGGQYVLNPQLVAGAPVASLGAVTEYAL